MTPPRPLLIASSLVPLLALGTLAGKAWAGKGRASDGAATRASGASASARPPSTGGPSRAPSNDGASETSAAAPPASQASADRASRHPPFVIEEKRIDARHHPDRQLVALAKAARKAHKRVLVDFGASWCVACELVKPVFWRAENQALFRDWELVQVDVDQLPDGPVLGIPFDTIPFFMKLDATGHVAGTLRGSDVLGGRPTDAEVDAAFAKFLGT